MRKLEIFDTTLRDGEQSLGITLNADEKIEIAKQLVRLGVDVIEAGFPASSPGDAAAVRRIGSEVRGVTVCGLTRAIRSDIDTCAAALETAERPRIHTGIATSPIHRERKLRKSPDQVVEMAVDAVSYARNLVPDVEFYAEDAFRTEREFLQRIVSQVIRAGATVINIPDTVGYATPWEFAELITWLRANVEELDRVTISVHCHNDLGMATANSLAGIKAGATQVEGTINGIGERAGNAALEEIIMAIYSQKSQYGVEVGVNTKEISRTSQMVSMMTGVAVQPYKAIVGSNAYSHASGIHQDGVLKDRATYEVIRPEDVGLSSNRIVLTSRSGRHALRTRLKELGYEIQTEDVERIYDRFLEVADAKGRVEDADLADIVAGKSVQLPEVAVKLASLQVTAGGEMSASAVAKLRINDRTTEDAAVGSGPVDAAFRVIERLTGADTTLVEYSLRAVTSGRDAVGEAIVRVRADAGADVVGRGFDTDVVKASALAYVDAINKLVEDGKVSLREPADEDRFANGITVS